MDVGIRRRDPGLMENVVMSTPLLKRNDRIPNSKRIRPFIGMQHPDREKKRITSTAIRLRRTY